MEIGFLHPDYLWFLIGVPILIAVHFITIKYLRRRAFLFANFRAVARVLGSSQDISVNTLPVILRAAVLVALTFAVSGLFIQDDVMRTDVDFVIALDTSSSMMATDFSPNRLEAAKGAIIKFSQSLDGLETGVGVVYFSGLAQTGVETTSDLQAIRDSVSAVKVSSVGGTAIGDAILVSTNYLMDSEKGRVIILLTDGQSNVGASPLTAVNFAVDNSVMIHTIGVGTPMGSSIVNSTLISKLDEKTLQTIASSTGGKYYPAENQEELAAAFEQLATASNDTVSTDLSPLLMLFGLSALIIEWLFINTKYRTLP